MRTKNATLLSLLLFSSALAIGCGGSEPESEATWETHTAAPGDSAGGEAPSDGATDSAAE